MTPERFTKSVRAWALNIALGLVVSQPVVSAYGLSVGDANGAAFALWGSAFALLWFAWARWRFSDTLVASWFCLMIPKCFMRHAVTAQTHSVDAGDELRDWCLENGIIHRIEVSLVAADVLKGRLGYDCRFLRLKDAVHFKLMWVG